VNVIVHAVPIAFSVTEGARPIEGVRHMPAFEFYDSGYRGNTRDCIERVLHWQRQNPHLTEALDERMHLAGVLAQDGLLQYQIHSEDGLQKIKEAMEQAQSCLEQWGLLTPELLTQKFDLLKQGALAVKLTGAGLGGFWVALWPGRGPELLDKSH